MKVKIFVMILCGALMTGCSRNTDERSGSDMVSTEENQTVKTWADYEEYEKILPKIYEAEDYKILLEAEDCEQNSGVSAECSVQGYSGTGFAMIRSNADFKIVVDIPASQHYTVTAVHRADGYKENPLLINGAKVMSMVSEMEWKSTKAENIFLEKGINEITLGEGWSWFNLDSIMIENGASLSDDLYSGISDSLSNKNANAKTRRIYSYLRDIYGKRTILGQCTAYGEHTEFDSFYKAFGKYPALRTFDFLYDSYTTCSGNPPAKDVSEAAEWSKQGGLVVFDWHWNDPVNNTFYADSTKFSLADAVTSENISGLSDSELDKLLGDGEITGETRLLVRDIDLIAGLLKQMEDQNVTVLWRPLHEAEGGWFWWGASGAENYKWLWRLMYHRMTDYHELNNLIWVWNGQNPEWYPSDEYCDIISIDIYNTPHDNSTSANVLADYQKITKSKPAAIAECATMTDPKQIVRDNAYWLWFATWIGEYVINPTTKEVSGLYTSEELMKEVFDSEVIITLDELPDFDME